MKTLAPRKAKIEGNIADVRAESFFNCMLAVRFRYGSEGQDIGASAIFSRLVDGQGQQALSSLIITGDCDYGRNSLVNYLRSKGIRNIFVMPDHLARVHPFLPA